MQPFADFSKRGRPKGHSAKFSRTGRTDLTITIRRPGLLLIIILVGVAAFTAVRVLADDALDPGSGIQGAIPDPGSGGREIPPLSDADLAAAKDVAARHPAMVSALAQAAGYDVLLSQVVYIEDRPRGVLFQAGFDKPLELNGPWPDRECGEEFDVYLTYRNITKLVVVVDLDKSQVLAIAPIEAEADQSQLAAINAAKKCQEPEID